MAMQTGLELLDYIEKDWLLKKVIIISYNPHNMSGDFNLWPPQGNFFDSTRQRDVGTNSVVVFAIVHIHFLPALSPARGNPNTGPVMSNQARQLVEIQRHSLLPSKWLAALHHLTGVSHWLCTLLSEWSEPPAANFCTWLLVARDVKGSSSICCTPHGKTQRGRPARYLNPLQTWGFPTKRSH